MPLPAPAVTRLQVLAALGVGAGAAAIASCSRSSSGDGRIRQAMFHAPESKLNPLTNDGSKLTRWSCAESLTRLTADGDAQELLATTWKREGETTWRCTLREGVTFHDGTALSAENAVAALTFAASAAKPPRVLDGINLTAKADGKDLLLTTAAPDPLMPQRVSSPQLAILSRHRRLHPQEGQRLVRRHPGAQRQVLGQEGRRPRHRRHLRARRRCPRNRPAH